MNILDLMKCSNIALWTLSPVIQLQISVEPVVFLDVIFFNRRNRELSSSVRKNNSIS